MYTLVFVCHEPASPGGAKPMYADCAGVKNLKTFTKIEILVKGQSK